jgi:hypothetical protein
MYANFVMVKPFFLSRYTLSWGSDSEGGLFRYLGHFRECRKSHLKGLDKVRQVCRATKR